MEFGSESVSFTPRPTGATCLQPRATPEELDLCTGTPRDTKLTVRNLVNQTTEVNDWYMMGVQVDVEPTVLKEIEETCPMSVNKRKTELFDHWLRTDVEASWEKLATGLDDMQTHKVLAERIRKIAVMENAPTKKRQTGLEFRSPTTQEVYQSARGRLLDSGYKTASTDRCFSQYMATGSLRAESAVSSGFMSPEHCLSYKVDTNVVAVKFGVLAEVKQVHTGDPVVCGNSKCTAVLNSYSVVDKGKKVPGKFAIKAKGQSVLDKLYDQFAQGENQYLPRERRDVSYVSRLQSVQAAVDNELATILHKDTKKRVALVTFNSEVTIVGDGKLDEVIIAGDKLSSYEALMKIGSELPVPSRIGQIRQYLGEKIWSLEEEGQTALGPALLLSVLLAGKAPGSKVIVCTDGRANKGLGQLDETQQFESAAAYYTNIGTLAKDKSVTVSMLTIKGTQTGLLALGKVPLMTGGNVNIVDPLTIKDEFSNILSTPVIATGVSAKLVTHKDMYISTPNESLLQVTVGNVTADAGLSYPFGFRQGTTTLQTPPGKKKKKKTSTRTSANAGSTTPLSVGGVPHLPFQVQISYTAPDGSSYLRVITSTRPLAKTVEEAMKGANSDVMSTFAVQQSAKLATEGKLEEAAAISSGMSEFLENSAPSRSRELRNISKQMHDSPTYDESAMAVLEPSLPPLITPKNNTPRSDDTIEDHEHMVTASEGACGPDTAFTLNTNGPMVTEHGTSELLESNKGTKKVSWFKAVTKRFQKTRRK